MKTLKFTILAVLCTCLCSCSDFLELSPVSNMNENDFYQTEDDFETAVASAYATLYTEYHPEGGPSLSELLSDECLVYSSNVITSNGTNTDVYPWVTYSILTSNTMVASVWNNTYSSLNVVNKIIDNLQGVEFETEGLRDMYEGEMRFLRALYHFNLVRLFGPIPIVDHSVTVEESYSILRSDEDDVYDFIIDDLEYAISVLPLQSKIDRTGQITIGAAQTLLGKVYLTTGDNSSAATVLKKVIDSGEYALLDNYADLWDVDNENTEEGILEINYDAVSTTPSSPYMEYYVPYENFSITSQGRGLNQVTDVLWDNYEDGDPRREASIREGYNNSSGSWVDILFESKWYDELYIESNSYYHESNFIVLRYADVLLMYAEATSDATYLNMVRNRAGMPEYGSSDYPSDTYSTFALAIEHERQVELALEFHRFFDLKRTGRGPTVLTSAKGKTITSDMMVLPIPLEVIDQNPNITQNSYYE